MNIKLTLSTDSAERKNIPVYSGFIAYFPAAVAGAARISFLGNQKHNPGEPLHHARGKSMDHADCIVRHAMDVGDMEAAIKRCEPAPPLTAEVQALLDEADAMFWRAGAWSQELHEKYGGAPLAPGARTADYIDAGVFASEAFKKAGWKHVTAEMIESPHPRCQYPQGSCSDPAMSDSLYCEKHR